MRESDLRSLPEATLTDYTQALSTNIDAVAAWAGQPLTDDILNVLTHFLLTKPSHHTRMAYARDLLEFLRFAEDSGWSCKKVMQVSEKQVLLWKDHLTQKHSRFEDSRRRVVNSSVARKLCTLASFFDFALKRKLIGESPLQHMVRPKVRRMSHATVLSDEELRLVLKCSRERLEDALQSGSQKQKENVKELQRARLEWCLLTLLFTVGMRVSELCQLKLNDLTLEGDILRLHLLAKGGVPHSPLIHTETARVLMDYIRTERCAAHSQAPLFPAGRSNSGVVGEQHIHRSTVFRIVREAAARAGIKRAFSPHGCRATLATQLHLNAVPVVEIQRLLNHAQVTTTQLYLHRVDEVQEAAALQLPWVQNNKLSPKSRA